jgi:hypothetical protein
MKDRKVKHVLSRGWYQWRGWGEGHKEKVKGGKYVGNIMNSCMKMEQWDLLKRFQEWGVREGIKDNDGMYPLEQQ